MRAAMQGPPLVSNVLFRKSRLIDVYTRRINETPSIVDAERIYYGNLCIHFFLSYFRIVLYPTCLFVLSPAK